MKNAYLDNDTIAAVATPWGTGAIGIIRVSGYHAIQYASSLVTLSNSLSLESLPSQKSAVGIFHQNGNRIDQVIVTIYRTPRSYTGEDIVEISCHGGTAVLKQILGLFVNRGCRVAEAGEFSQRAFLNGKMDLVQAEAVADLIHAQTEVSRSVALSQMEGNLTQEVGQIRNFLVEILAHIEVVLDHSDDSTVGLTMTLNETGRKLDDLIVRLRYLIQSYDFGRIAREGIKIAIIGKPNVGKSSLLNCLVKDERAIVTATPGTTRDTIEEGFDLLGLPAVLVDTAGVRGDSRDPIERIGIERTQKAIASADAVLVLLDSSESIWEDDRKIVSLLQGKDHVVVVLNKNDLSPRIDPEEVKRLFPLYKSVSISALRNSGIQNLLEALHHLVSPLDRTSQKRETDVIVSSSRHHQCLLKCEEGLLRARLLCRDQKIEECIALEIKESLDCLGEITGEVVTEDILNEIFSRFCIGK